MSWEDTRTVTSLQAKSRMTFPKARLRRPETSMRPATNQALLAMDQPRKFWHTLML